MEVEILLFQIAMKINWREMRFSIMKREFTICDKENHSKSTCGPEKTGRGKHGV